MMSEKNRFCCCVRPDRRGGGCRQEESQAGLAGPDSSRSLAFTVACWSKLSCCFSSFERNHRERGKEERGGGGEERGRGGGGGGGGRRKRNRRWRRRVRACMSARTCR